ncbi:MAG: site-specific integrase, partial [Chloroflexota bacterium]
KGSPYWWISWQSTSKQSRNYRATTYPNIEKYKALATKEEKAQRQQTKQARAQGLDDVNDPTFDEIIAEFIHAHQHTDNHSRDKHALKHLNPIFTDQRWRKIQRHHIKSYITQRQKQGAANSTINKETGLIGRTAIWAKYEKGWDIHNPAERTKLKEPPGLFRWLTRQEYTALIDAAQHARRAPYLADFIELCAFTGFRKSEALELEWTRVDFDNELIYLAPENQKNKTTSSIPMHPNAKASLLRRKSHQSKHCPTTPWVFTDYQGKRVEDVKRSFSTAVKRAGLKEVTPHTLRHTFASWLVQNDVEIVKVSKLMRHSDIKMTMRYAHLAPNTNRKEIEKI